MQKVVKRDNQVGETSTKPERSPRSSHVQESASTPMENNEVRSEYSSMESSQMGFQCTIILEDKFVSSLESYRL